MNKEKMIKWFKELVDVKIESIKTNSRIYAIANQNERKDASNWLEKAEEETKELEELIDTMVEIASKGE